MNEYIPKEAKLIRAYYEAVGPKLQIDSLTVEFEIEDEKYTHQLPNREWSAKTPALSFMGFLDIKPSGFDGNSINLEGRYIPVQWEREQDQYLITRNALIMGASMLKSSDWFDKDGEVWSGGGNISVGSGGSADPGTGNQGAIDLEEIER